MSEKSDKLWKKDDYLKPVDSNDPMLMYDIEEDEQGNLLKGNDKNIVRRESTEPIKAKLF